MSNAMQLEHGDWELRLGDCLDSARGMPGLGGGIADHVITDPPYSEHTHAKVRRGGSAHVQFRQATGLASISSSVALGFAELTPEVRSGVANNVARIATRWIMVFSDAESVSRWSEALETAGAEHVRAGAWFKVGATPQFTGDRPGTGYEAIEIAHAARESGRMRWNGGGRHGAWTYPVESGNRAHPTQKPLALMEALVRDFTDPGDLILDPFAGSGTTGVACRRLGRRFLGWERDPKFHAAAMKRIGAAREQLGLLSRARAPKVEQGDMFKAAKVRS